MELDCGSPLNPRMLLKKIQSFYLISGESSGVGQKENKNIGTNIIKNLFSIILLLLVPTFVSVIPLLEYMSIKIQTFHFDMNNV